MPAPKVELTEEEWLFQRLLMTPSVFSDWIRPHIEDPKTYKGLWRKQIREINREDKKKKRIQGRYLGKTITASDEFKLACITWTAPTGTALFATRQESNLQPVFERELIGAFRRVPFLRLFLPNGDAGVNRKSWQITLQNGVVIRGRIEGSEGAGFQTIHPDVIAWWDEVQMLSDDAVAEMYGMISDELRQLASGVPNGVRSSWAYSIDNDSSLGWAGGKMTRHDDPRYTEAMDNELIKFYGGVASSGYRNRVLGEWGDDAQMTFDMERIVRDLPLAEGHTRGVQPTFYRSIELSASDLVQSDGSPRLDVLQRRFAFKGDMPHTNRIWLHADHGQSASPTTLYITFWDVKEKCWRQYHRILLRGMEAPTQAQIIHWLVEQIPYMTGGNKIEPAIGFDTTGHGGSAVMALLQNMGHKNLVRVDVREAVDTHQKRLETDDEFRKRYAKDPFSPPTKQLVPIYQRWRQVAFPRLAREFYAERLRLVNEDALVNQLAGATDYEAKNGERVYETDYTVDGLPYNHDMSAMEILGAMLHTFDEEEASPVADVWIEEFDVGWGVIDSGAYVE